MLISDIMTRTIGSCTAQDTLHEAAHIMWECDCGCVPIVDENRQVIGIVTDRDVCMAGYTKDMRLKDILISEIMTTAPFCCNIQDSTITAEELMQTHQIRRLPVVDQNGLLVGMLSLNDLALEYEREKKQKRKDVNADQVSSTLSAICSHTH